MSLVTLFEVAHGRSGDKGDAVNIGVVARHPELYPPMCAALTADAVRAWFGELCKGDVVRYELPNIHALNFVLTKSLDGGGTVSLRSDAQGKTYSAALMRMPIEVPDNLRPLFFGQTAPLPG